MAYGIFSSALRFAEWRCRPYNPRRILFNKTVHKSQGAFAMRFSPSIRHRLAPVSILALLISAPVLAQQKQAQQMDEDFARSVKEWTTRPEFMSPLVDHLPKVAGVPSPKDRSE